MKNCTKISIKKTADIDYGYHEYVTKYQVDEQ